MSPFSLALAKRETENQKGDESTIYPSATKPSAGWLRSGSPRPKSLQRLLNRPELRPRSSPPNKLTAWAIRQRRQKNKPAASNGCSKAPRNSARRGLIGRRRRENEG